MQATSSGIQPHTREERREVIEKLVPLWQQKFGDNLLAIAVSASVGRGEDQSYSDLELDVFLKEKPAEGEDQFLQRVVDGMLIEAIYHTPETYFDDRAGIAPHWHNSASDRLVPVYNPALVVELNERIQAICHSKQEFIQAATRERFELQESFCKVLNAVEQVNLDGISLLVMDASLHLLQVLALLNQHSFTTFSRYIPEARSFSIKPEQFDEFLDILVTGNYWDLDHLERVILAVFTSLERIFVGYGIQLYQDSLDPNLPNSPELRME